MSECQLHRISHQIILIVHISFPAQHVFGERAIFLAVPSVSSSPAQSCHSFLCARSMTVRSIDDDASPPQSTSQPRRHAVVLARTLNRGLRVRYPAKCATQRMGPKARCPDSKLGVHFGKRFEQRRDSGVEHSDKIDESDNNDEIISGVPRDQGNNCVGAHKKSFNISGVS